MNGQPTSRRESAAGHGYVDLEGRRFYRIVDYDRLEPFFMTVVGSSDVWLFASSTGGLTAGRVSPESALFPYYTDDKVTESAGRTGGLTLVRLAGPAGGSVLWEPFAAHRASEDPGRRTLYKDVTGTALVFEEARADLGLRLRVTWETSDRFGVVRTCELANLTDRQVTVDLVDGFVNVLPAGVGMVAQNRLSNLLDAYKRSEVAPLTGLGIDWLSSRLTDLAEPSESLEANVAWQVGLDGAIPLASAAQLGEARRGAPVRAELLLLSPSFLVPCLTHNGIKIWDTLAIAEYLAEQYPKSQLLPEELKPRSHCRSISGEMHSGFYNLRSALPMNLRARHEGFQVFPGARADIDRILART